ncbi:MAG: type III pantothenate kinase [Crocinitomicaceae bacterium]
MPNILAIDIGNTRLKTGVFSNNKFVKANRISLKDIECELNKLAIENFDDVVISSVVSDELLAQIKQLWKAPIIVDSDAILPFENKYATPKTLGIDRLCNAMYGYTHSQTSTSVIIDLGTCLKFDVIDKSLGYLGGSISPGIHLRYKAMNQFTGNLPLLSDTKPTGLIGRTTHESMHSGVINGILAEMEGFMQQYSNKFQDLTFFVTGGDLEHFDLASKNDIFADENLTLKGLYEIYRHNA